MVYKTKIMYPIVVGFKRMRNHELLFMEIPLALPNPKKELICFDNHVSAPVVRYRLNYDSQTSDITVQIDLQPYVAVSVDHARTQVDNALKCGFKIL